LLIAAVVADAVAHCSGAPCIQLIGKIEMKKLLIAFAAALFVLSFEFTPALAWYTCNQMHQRCTASSDGGRSNIYRVIVKRTARQGLQMKK
jgi:hypothetical protein